METTIYAFLWLLNVLNPTDPIVNDPQNHEFMGSIYVEHPQI